MTAGSLAWLSSSPWASEGTTSSGERSEEDAVAVADLDQAADLQRGQRLAHGGAADAEALRELALGQQPVAGLELLDVDERPQPLDDLLVERAAADRLEARPQPQIVTDWLTGTSWSTGIVVQPVADRV